MERNVTLVQPAISHFNPLGQAHANTAVRSVQMHSVHQEPSAHHVPLAARSALIEVLAVRV